jgi:hypothetical protein
LISFSLLLQEQQELVDIGRGLLRGPGEAAQPVCGGKRKRKRKKRKANK